MRRDGIFPCCGKNPLDEQLITVFTDRSCSELLPTLPTKPSIGFRHSSMCWQSLCRAILIPKRKRDSGYSHIRHTVCPEYWGDKLRTNYYSPLCNPTGIITNAGEEMVVLADGIPQGESISLRCCSDLGPDGEERFLKNGINKFSFSRAEICLSSIRNLIPVACRQ